MKKILCTSLMISLSSIYVQAQTLFKYGNHEVSKDEFLKVYTKNNNGKDLFKKENVEDYLQLYALFKMRVAEAKALQMDTARSMRMEIENYKAQLAKNYLIDNKIIDNLIDEAYQRLQQEVSIAHILINSRGTDTTVAYNRIMEVYKDLENGKSFEQAAKDYSNDAGSANDGGAVGYISALDVHYPIENAAYNTPVGKYSKPFRSPLGYHIVKVLDKRPSRGKVQVAQILLPTNQSNKETVREKANDIIKQLNNGAAFKDMVATYSEDIHSKNNAGILEPFGTGTYEASFENAAFALKKKGDISTPVETFYGIHILQLIDKDDYKDVAKTKAYLKQRIQQDSRLKFAEDAYAHAKIKELGLVEHAEALQAISTAIQGDTAQVAIVNSEKYASFQQPLFSIQNKVYTQQDFIKHIETTAGGKIFGRKQQAVQDLYQIFKNKIIQQTQITDLEKNNSDFQFAMKEYQDALLVYAIIEENVWSKGMTDNEGIKAYYEANKNKYTFDQGFEGYLFESLDDKILAKLQERIRHGEEPTEAKEDLNRNDPSGQQILTEKATFEYHLLPNKVAPLENGEMSAIVPNPNKGFFFVVPIRNFPAGTPKPLEACRGLVITDYQKALEDNWNQTLRNKYPISIQQKELKKIIK